MSGPVKFPTPEILQEKIDAYFEYCDSSPINMYHKQLGKGSDTPIKMDIQRPYTVNGLCCFLGTNRQVLTDYQKLDGYKEIIEMAKERIGAHQMENSLVGAYDSRTVIFMLINNHGYVNEKKVDVTTGGQRIDKITVL